MEGESGKEEGIWERTERERNGKKGGAEERKGRPSELGEKLPVGAEGDGRL